MLATADADFTAQVDVGGLSSATDYWYAFDASRSGERSPVGRTRHSRRDIDHLRFAAVSCAKFNAGFFNAYARIAERDDLDFLLHLGDYIYEAAQNPPATPDAGRRHRAAVRSAQRVRDARRLPDALRAVPRATPTSRRCTRACR